MPRTNSTSWSTGDNVSATRLQQINADLDDLYSKGSDRLKVYASTGLNVLIGSGVFRVGSTEGIYAGGTVAMTDNATNYVMIDTAGTIQVSTSAWNSNYARLAVVTTVSGAITAIVVWRIDAIGGVLGGGITANSGIGQVSVSTYNIPHGLTVTPRKITFIGGRATSSSNTNTYGTYTVSGGTMECIKSDGSTSTSFVLWDDNPTKLTVNSVDATNINVTGTGFSDSLSFMWTAYA